MVVEIPRVLEWSHLKLLCPSQLVPLCILINFGLNSLEEINLGLITTFRVFAIARYCSNVFFLI